MSKQSWKNKQTAGPLTASLKTLCPEFFLKRMEKNRRGHRMALHRSQPIDFCSRSNPVRLVRRSVVATV